MQYSTLKMTATSTSAPGPTITIKQVPLYGNKPTTGSLTPIYRTPFEQAAYDIQYRKPNRTSGPDLGSSLTPDISETVSDRDLLLAGVLLLAFIILLIVV